MAARVGQAAVQLLRTYGQVALVMHQYEEGRWYDEAFDAGEWSGPATDRAMARAVRDVVLAAGYDMDTFGEQLADVLPGAGEWAYALAGLGSEEGER